MPWILPIKVYPDDIGHAPRYWTAMDKEEDEAVLQQPKNPL